MNNQLYRVRWFFVIFFMCGSCIIGQTPKKESNKKIRIDWFHQDLSNDSVPGISLAKAYEKILDTIKKQEVIVAIIDMAVDVNHEDLKGKIWSNANEVPNNNIDDDKNGYIDDVHGWNFLGNEKGENILFTNYEYTRIIRKYDSIFKGKVVSDISKDQKDDFLQYSRAKKKYENQLVYAKNDKAYIDYYDTGYIAASKALANYFPEKRYTKKKLDSIKSLYKDDKVLNVHLDYMLVYVQYKLTQKWIQDYKLKAYERLNKLLNLDYDERLTIIGDDPEDITNIVYGNNQVNNNIDIVSHGTKIAGTIGAIRNNDLGTNGVVNNVKIMPLCVSPLGDEHDKDMALAIQYAADNGAKVINISSGKEFSLHQDWVLDAIKYAEEKEVLIVTSSGNEGLNIDNLSVYNYPDDMDKQGNEVASNFIKVGSSSNFLDHRLISLFSNYGKQKVDLFAPGDKVLTLIPDNNYELDKGTSISCAVVSGVAALIRSCYPDLSAAKVKEILMKSGTSYDIKVEIEEKDKTKKLVPFSELSKSGKIVNAYNALFMAKQISLE
ncbi:S8 family serine peptidase [Aquimarina sp. MMG015]|uniref:S8 family serine peptidase n=1 Tax=Aquimarina sp. MMG015 TaxID=2822689 RepID=UPI001B3A5F49|nr:S8 family serine peptidase [Aquimarina sp. MMG015]